MFMNNLQFFFFVYPVLFAIASFILNYDFTISGFVFGFVGCLIVREVLSVVYWNYNSIRETTVSIALGVSIGLLLFSLLISALGFDSYLY